METFTGFILAARKLLQAHLNNWAEALHRRLYIMYIYKNNIYKNKADILLLCLFAI